MWTRSAASTFRGSVTGLYLGNKVFHVGPINGDTAFNEEGCGLNSVSETNNSANILQDNWVNDAYCGVAYTSSDVVLNNTYMNTLYDSINGDNNLDTFPPPTEPGQSPFVATPRRTPRRARKIVQ